MSTIVKFSCRKKTNNKIQYVETSKNLISSVVKENRHNHLCGLIKLIYIHEGNGT